jgi:hypothetical protein
MESLPASLPVADPVKLAAALRRQFPANEASALAEQLTLRVRAGRNHGGHRGLLYTPQGLEMMTHPVVAERRAVRLASLGLPVADLTCGLGGDLRAVSERRISAVGLETDGATALFAQANVPDAAIVRGDAGQPPFEVAERALIIDPSRREGGSRRFDPRAFAPPWDTVLRLAAEARAAVVKAPPGMLDTHVPRTAEVEAVQLGTSMREMTLWFGAAATPGLRRAVLLPSGESIDSTEPEADAGVAAPGPFLFDPESCVTRATLVRQLAQRLGASMLDFQVAYLSASEPALSPLAATFEVLDELPFSVNRLRYRLRAGGWRPDEIRRRAFPVEPDELRRLLGKLEGEPVTLLLTTLSGRRTVFIARRLFRPA